MGGFLGEVAKKAGANRGAAQALGLQNRAARERTPPIVPPGEPTPDRPARTAPQPGTPPPGRSLGPIPEELRASLNRVLGGQKQRMLSEETRQFGRGDDRNQFFNLHGRTPTPRELSAFNLTRDLERRLGRPPTVQEVRSELRNSDFVDPTPDPF